MLKPKFDLRNNPAYKEGSILGSTDVGTKIAPVPLTFTRASKGYVEKASGLTEMSSSLPRIDKDGRILFEPQRTNLLTWSQDFSNAAWNKINNTISSNVEVAPDGTLTADKLESNTTGNISVIIRQSVTVSNSTDYTITFYAKKSEANFIQIYFGSGQVSGNPKANFNLLNGTIGDFDSGITPKITPVNDFYEISVTVESSSTTLQPHINMIKSATDTRGQANNWTIGDGVYIWNAQLEQGSYPTSPIKTEGSTATRVADSSSLSGLKAKGLIGASAGSIGGEFYSEELVRSSTNFSLVLGSGANDYIALRRINDTPQRLYIVPAIGGSSITTYLTTQDYNKWLFAWDSNGWFLSINGSVVSSGSGVFTFPTDNLTLGGAGGAFNQGTLFTSQTKYTESESTEYTSYNTYEEMAMLLGYTID